MATAAARRHFQLGSNVTDTWPLAIGLAVLAIPTAVSLATQTWSREDGAQGPLILATGGWLLWRQLPAMRAGAVPGSSWAVAALLLPSLGLYVAGRAFDFVTLEAAGLYGVGLAVLQANFGSRTLLKVWFPLLYLAFAIPPPSSLIDHLTAPLKHFAAFVTTDGLRLFGLPISREGVTILIAQYQLLVEDACSGMNSLMGLTAISLLYIYLMRRASPVYALLLSVLVIPIAILANIVRIVVIVLVTYAFGDSVGQSFIHVAAGLFLFTTALLLVFALDNALSAGLSKLGIRL